ncbi:MAG: family 1 glycosylhydrolase [Acidimicrobiales bacterium]
MSTPAGFSWGTGASSIQAEGAAPASDWWAWEQAGKAPASAEGNGLAVDYATDFALFAASGLTDVRITAEWARIEPAQGRVDAAELERYAHLLTAALDAGLRPWVTLHDRTLPGWWAIDERGFRERRARSYYWPRHVERCAEAFGALAYAFVPVMRPVSWAAGAFLAGWAPPGSVDLRAFREALLGARLGALEAWRVLRGADALVALCCELTVAHRADESQATRLAAGMVDDTYWSWTEAFRDGLVRVPELGPVEAALHRDAFDLIGVCFDGAVTVHGDGTLTPRNDPEGLAAALDRAAGEGPERPLVLLGHTSAGGDDQRDAEELGITLDAAAEARRAGVDLRGWFEEPAVDGYELLEGFAAERGLFTRSRAPKAKLAALQRAMTGAG